jgi:cephalosporin hydroxylase
LSGTSVVGRARTADVLEVNPNPALPSVTIDPVAREVHVGDRRLPFSDPEAFALVSELWIQAGWDAKHVYTFAWMGRPIIQLPEDLLRLQELIYDVKPDVVLETGIAHGGSLVFYASLLKAMGRGRVVGVDLEIRPQNKLAIDSHELRPLITTIEGDAIAPETIARVRSSIAPGERVLLVLDSKHTRDHVVAELRAYADLVAVGSAVVVADGIMRDVVGAPRTSPTWTYDNPVSAVDAFLAERPEFERMMPPRLFDESLGTGAGMTYFRDGWLRRIR